MRKTFLFFLALNFTFSTFNSVAQTPGPGNGLLFNGGTNAVNYGDVAVADFGVNDFSVEFWINTTTSGVWQPVISKRVVCGHHSFWNILMNPTGNIRVELDGPGGANYNSLTGAISLNDGNWHHVALTRTGASASLYIDGVLDLTQLGPGTTNITNTASLRIGDLGFACWGPFNGTVDEFRIWNVARSQTQIQDDMCRELTGNEANLTGYWNMNEGTGLTVNDLTINANNGTRQ